MLGAADDRHAAIGAENCGCAFSAGGIQAARRARLVAAVADRGLGDTEFIAGQIAAVLQPGPEDRLLDIGCGDGALLRRVAPGVARAAALDLSPVALARVKQSLSGSGQMFCTAGISEAIPFCDAAFTMVVINSVLYALGSYEEAERTVIEVRRVLRRGGIAYFGEIPTIDERKGARPGGGPLGTMWMKLKRHGPRTICRLFWERRRETVQIIAPDTFLYWGREAFVATLGKHAFRVEQVLPHRVLSGITSRLNYVAVHAGY